MAHLSIWRPVCRRPFVLLALALSALCSPAASGTFITYGPGIVSPAGYGALLAVYSSGHVPYNSSAPTISVGLSLSLSTDPTLSGMDQALQFAVELVNFRGGVSVSGQQHYLSLTYADDGGSSVQAQSLYGSMLSWHNQSAFLAPSSDAQLQAVSAQLAAVDALTLAVDDTDPADYASSAPCLFSQLNTATSRWTAALSAVNAQAQSYATAGGSGSVNGIKTFCMFSTPDALTQAAAVGVRQWIAAENARRGNTDNITVYVDARWYYNATGTYKDYVPYLSACPDGVDVMLLQDANMLSLDVALALTASQLRPRAVLGIQPNNAQLALTPTAAAGWTLALSTLSVGSASTLLAVGGRFASYADLGTGLYYWCAGANTTANIPLTAYLYYGALDVLLATISQSASLAAADLRAGLLLLNGRSSILGPLAFDAATGINEAPQTFTGQVLSNGSPQPVTPSTPLSYPWRWPHVTAKPDPIRYVTYGPGVVSPLGVQYLLAAYNMSYVPRNASAPTLSVGLSLSLGLTSLLTNMDTIVQYIVDLVNFRGGVNVGGVWHYLSITYATDGASDELTQYIYQDMYLSGQYAVYLAPMGDDLLQSLSSFLSSTQSLMFSVYNEDPVDYLTPDTNLVSLINTAQSRWQSTLTVINYYAGQYAASGGAGSVNGIKTFCMLSTNDTIVQAAAVGVREWIAAENAKRGNTDNITVYVDGLWAANITGGYVDYLPYLAACPDGVDVMLLQDGSITTTNVQQALAASRLRPKAAIGLDPATGLLTGQLALQAAGWVVALPAVEATSSSLFAAGGKWSNFIDILYSLNVWCVGANISSVTPTVGYGYVTAIDILAAALTRTASLQSADIRAAVQSLNGQTGILGPLDFSNITGINVAPGATLEQVQSTGDYMFILTNQSDLVSVPGSVPLAYPYDWPWPRLIQTGDTLDAKENSGLAILGVVICVLGAWVAQIIVEQSIFVRRKGGWYQLWLLVVALALGAVSIWCAILMSASGLTVSIPGGDSLYLSYAFDVAMLTWLPAVLLTWCGLMVLMGDVETTAVRGASRASQAQQALREQKEAKKKRAALSNQAHFYHLVQAVTWRSVVGGVLVAAAIGVTRSVMWYIWVQDASFESAGWAWAVTTLFNAVCVPLTMLMYFHALRWRVAAVFMFAVCVMVDYQVQLTGLTFYYQPGRQSQPSSLLTADIDTAIVNLIAGIIAAFICFIFIGLQFSRMRLSRNGLSVLVASLEAVINKQKDHLRVEMDANTTLRAQLTAALRLVEHINIVTPVPTEYAFAMASSTQLETFQSLYAMPAASSSTLVRASQLPSTMSLMRSSDGSSGGGVNGVGERGKMLGVARMSNTSRGQRLSRQMTVEEVAELAEQNADVRRASDGAEREPNNRLEGTTSALPLLLASNESHNERALRSKRTSSHKVVPVMRSTSGSTEAVDSAEADDTVEDGLTLPSAVSTVVAAAVSPRRKVAEASESGLTHGASFNMRIVTAPSSPIHAKSGAAHTLNQPVPASPTSSSATSKFAIPKAITMQSRSNEDELTAAMDAHLAYREGLALVTPKNHGGSTSLAPKANRVGGIGGTTPGEDDSFDLSMPLLGNKDSVQPSAITPTLQMLLSHPVCVEILKAELLAIHSVENLIFYLHAVRYRLLQSAKLRKLLATAIHSHFIREHAPQQININTRQRDAITATVTRKGDDCPAELFREAEREVLMLMETNVMKAMAGTATMRLCSWVLATVPMGAVTSAQRGAERVLTKEPSMLLSDVMSSVTGGKHSERSSKHR